MASERWKVIHGDCLDVMAGMAPFSVDAIVTDPPYAITNDAGIATSRTNRMPPETQFFAAWLREHMSQWVRVLKPTGAVWLTLDWRGCVILDDISARLGVRRAPKVGVWDKEMIGMGGVLRSSYETFAVLMMDDFAPLSRSTRDVWRHSWGGGRTGETTHPAEKPLGLMQSAIELVCPAGGLVLDPFAGSGSTGVAAVKLERAFVGIEKDGTFAEMARARIAGTAAQTAMTFPPPFTVDGPFTTVAAGSGHLAPDFLASHQSEASPLAPPPAAGGE